MSQTYKMKGSFDKGTTWYQFEWDNVDFVDFEKVSTNCNSITELTFNISEKYPECNLIYKYLGERRKRK